MANDIPNYFSAGFGAVSSIFGGITGFKADEASAKGSEIAAAAFEKASGIAGENAVLTGFSTEIQDIAAKRKIEKTIAAQQSAIAGAGFEGGSGSAGDLLRESTTQGHLTTQAIGLQGTINENAYLAQETALEGEAGQARATAEAQHAAGQASLFGGVLGAVGKIASLFF